MKNDGCSPTPFDRCMAKLMLIVTLFTERNAAMAVSAFKIVLKQTWINPGAQLQLWNK